MQAPPSHRLTSTLDSSEHHTTRHTGNRKVLEAGQQVPAHRSESHVVLGATPQHTPRRPHAHSDATHTTRHTTPTTTPIHTSATASTPHRPPSARTINTREKQREIWNCNHAGSRRQANIVPPISGVTGNIVMAAYAKRRPSCVIRGQIQGRGNYTHTRARKCLISLPTHAAATLTHNKRQRL